MPPGSLASKARVSPSSTAVVMLIHRTWDGSTASVEPVTIASSTTRPCARLVGTVQARKVVRLAKTPRPSSIAASMVAKSSSRSTMSAASLATSVPDRPMAMPIWA